MENTKQNFKEIQNKKQNKYKMMIYIALLSTIEY